MNEVEGHFDRAYLFVPFTASIIGSFILFRIARESDKEEKYLPDKLVFEPTYDEILKMNVVEMQAFVSKARMTGGCEPDNGNRAMIRACYLINEAYKMNKVKENEEES